MEKTKERTKTNKIGSNEKKDERKKKIAKYYFLVFKRETSINSYMQESYKGNVANG